ncbi:MAG: DUF72 domain-containing protein [Nitrososphaerales archaeon]
MYRIGTSGYSYQDWKKIFYPGILSSSQFLKYYAKYFDSVEIDSTYYRIPPPSVFEQIAKKVPSNFRFSVKTPSTFTHQRRKYPETIEPFRRSISPLVNHGLLGCILAQFPFSFRPSTPNLEHIARIGTDLKKLAPLCVEFRHDSWQRDDVYSYLEERGIGYVNVDLPHLEGLPKPSSVTTSELGYVRFHGRVPYEMWWNPPKSHERYNHAYSERELEEWVPKIKTIGEKTKNLYFMFNNHYNAKSVRAALMMKRLLGMKVEEPPSMRETQQVLF